MGTSRSHPGAGSGSPLIPAHADPSNLEPSPPAPPSRFKAFRTSLGKFAATGDERQMRSALRHFAATSLGGAAAGARRFTSMAAVGADAILALRTPGGVAAVLRKAGVDLDALRNGPVEAVIEAFARALAPDDADKEKVEQALRDAFSQTTGEDVDLDLFGTVTEDQQVEWIATYLEGCVLQQIQDEGATALDKAATPAELQAREDQLREAVQTAIASHLQPLADAGIANLANRDTLVAAQKAVVARVLQSWEGWDG